MAKTSITGIPNQQNRKHVLRSIALYYAIACGFAWIVWLPLALGPDGLKLHNHPISLPVSACIGTLGPMLACFLCYRRETGGWRAVRLLPSQGRWIWLLLGPLLVFFCFFFLFPALLTKGGPQAWHWNARALAGIWIPMFNYNLLGGPLFEEFGWRGYLQPRVQTIMPPWIATICVAVMWAAWHLPLFLVGWISATPLVFTFMLTGLSLIMASAFNASGGAVAVTILMHSAFNCSSQFLPSFLGGVTTRDYPSGETLLGCSFLLVGVAAVVFTRGRLCVQELDERYAVNQRC